MKDRQKLQNEKRKRLKHRIHKKIHGTPERPRLVVYRGNKNIEAQIVDDISRLTICSIHSRSLQSSSSGSGKEYKNESRSFKKNKIID